MPSSCITPENTENVHLGRVIAKSGTKNVFSLLFFAGIINLLYREEKF